MTPEMWYLKVGASFALEAVWFDLFGCDAGARVPPFNQYREELDEIRAMRAARKNRISGACRPYQDRFAAFCDDCRLNHEQRDALKPYIFRDWLDWNTGETVNIEFPE